MTLIDRLLAPFGYSKASPRPPGALLSMADSQRWEMPDASVAEKQIRLYAMLTWIATAIDHVAGIGSAGIFSVMETGTALDDDQDDEDIPNHPFELLLRRPNPKQSRGEFLRDSLSWYKATGNLYWHLNKTSEFVPPDELWIVPSTMIKPIPDGKSFILGYEFTAPGKSAEFIPPWQILHLKTFNPFSPFVGLSQLQSLALDAYGDIAQQKWNLKIFDKENGTLPIVLAFKHMIGDPEWAKMKKEKDDRSSVMMLRGVGDTVQLLQAASNRKEMDFLAGRTFTKEEIYDKLAPGLASILSVNATEANAIAGKSTLIEFAVWPLLDQLAQKITSEILPLYGENLVGEFDDMRQTNRIIDLQEQAEFAKYHTVNEVRAEYYDEGPLEIDPEILKLKAAADAEQAKLDAAAPPPMAVLPAQPAPFGKKADMPTPQGGEIPVSKLDPRGFLFPAQISPTTPNPADVAKPTPPGPAMVPGQPPVTQPEGDAVPDEAEVKAELEAWERYALKRVGKDGREFEPRLVDFIRGGRIKAGVKAAKTAADIHRVFEKERGGGELADAAAELKRFNDYINGPSQGG